MLETSPIFSSPGWSTCAAREKEDAVPAKESTVLHNTVLVSMENILAPVLLMIRLQFVGSQLLYEEFYNKIITV